MPRADFSCSGGSSWTSHRRRCGTLATNSMQDMEQRTCQTRRAAAWMAICLMAPGGLIATIWPAPRDCGRKFSLLPASCTEKCEEYFAFRSRCVICAGIRRPILLLLRHACTDCNRPDRSSGDQRLQSTAVPAFASSELAATMRCIIAINRFCSGLLNSATVSRCAARAAASI